MAFDPSILSEIQGPDVAGAVGRGYQLKDLVNQTQLGKMKLDEAKTQQSDMAKIKELGQKHDLSTFEGQSKFASEAMKINPTVGMGLMKQFQATQAGQGELELQQYQLMGAKNDIIAQVVMPLKQFGDGMAQQGKNDAEINAQLMPKVIQTIQQLQQMKLPNGKAVLEPHDMQNIQQLMQGGNIKQAVDMIEMNSKKAAEAIKLKLEERKVQVSEKSEAERERKDRETQSLNERKFERSAGGGLTKSAMDEIAEQALTGDVSGLTGLSKADKAAVRNRLADMMEIRGLKGGDLAAKNAEFFGIKAGERTLGTRQANIDSAVTEAQKILPIVREASHAVPRGGFVPWTKLFQIAERGDSDPKLYAFAQAARSFANIYTRAVVPGASGVTDREESIKNLPTYTDQKSFDAVLDIMEKEMAAAKASPAEVRKNLADDISARPVRPAPQPDQNKQAPKENDPLGIR